MLLADSACGKLIGEKGRRIQELQDSTNTLINISRKGEYFPESDGKRVISISGFTVESLLSVIQKAMDTADYYGDHGTLARCILVTSNEGAETLLANNSHILNKICTLDHEREGLSVIVQRERNADTALNERYIKIFSTSNDLLDVKNCVEKILEVICHQSVRQPVHLRVYPSSSISSKTCTTTRESRDDETAWRKTRDEFREMESTWKGVMGPLLCDNNKASSVKGDVERFSCNQVFNGLDRESNTYTVYDIERDCFGEPVFIRVN